jgi:DNA-binding transcriptional LysR family regulator
MRTGRISSVQRGTARAFVTRSALAIELQHLRYFLEVADQGSLTRAAQSLELAQPALSQALSNLERDFGMRLFRRHARGVELTAAGRAFYPKARQVLAASQEAVEAARAAAAYRGRLTLGFQPPWAEVGTALVQAVRRTHPDTAIAARDLYGAVAVHELRARRVDIALLWPPHDAPDLEYRAVLADPRTVCLSANHPLVGRNAIRLADIEDEPIPRVEPSQQRQADFWYLADRRTRPARVTPGIPRSFEEVVALIACGHAVYLGARSLSHALLRPGVVARPLVGADPAILAVAWLRGRDEPLLRQVLQAASAVGNLSA